MRFPVHSVGFWLALLGPYLVVLNVYGLVAFGKLSSRLLRPWFIGLLCVLVLPYFWTGLSYNRSVWAVAASSSFWACFLTVQWVQRRTQFWVLRAPETSQWTPWNSANVIIPAEGIHILVRDVRAISPWYLEKLGLSGMSERPSIIEDGTALKLGAGSRSVVLTSRAGFATGRPHIFFTKKLAKARVILASRSAKPGSIEKDRQGTRFFELHDPDGNIIEFVEDH